MRSIVAAIAALSVMPLAIQQCSSVPVITELYVPDVLGSSQVSEAAYFSFFDGDAGVQYAHFENTLCPTGWECWDNMIDLAAADPEIVNYILATVYFSISCNNPTADDASFGYQLTLLDTTGNVSEPADYSFTCLSSSTNTAPEILEVSFPDTIPGDDSAIDGSLSWQDMNAGVTTAYLTTIVCDAQSVCNDYEYDLTAYIPGIEQYYEGSFGFTIACDNQSGQAIYYEDAWTLEDEEGHLSNQWNFGYTCEADNILTVVGPASRTVRPVPGRASPQHLAVPQVRMIIGQPG